VKRTLLILIIATLSIQQVVIDVIAEEPSQSRLRTGPPIIVVVHGATSADRKAGWSKYVAQAWNCGEVREVTYTDAPGLNFARNSEEWAVAVQRQLEQIAQENPGRDIIIVGHSWGSVVAQKALSGPGAGEEGPIDLKGARVREFISLNSPLGREQYDVPLNMRQLQTDVSLEKSPYVDHWTNISDAGDPVSKLSHNLPEADNITISGSEEYAPAQFSEIGSHIGIWFYPKVAEHIRNTITNICIEDGKQLRKARRERRRERMRRRTEQYRKSRQQESESGKSSYSIAKKKEPKQSLETEEVSAAYPEDLKEEVIKEENNVKKYITPTTDSSRFMTYKQMNEVLMDWDATVEEKIEAVNSHKRFNRFLLGILPPEGVSPSEDGGAESAYIPTVEEIRREEARRQAKQESVRRVLKAVGAAAQVISAHKKAISKTSPRTCSGSHHHGICDGHTPEDEYRAAWWDYWLHH